jgi:hypothetical protein
MQPATRSFLPVTPAERRFPALTIKWNREVLVPFNLDALDFAGKYIPAVLVKGVLRTSGAPQFALSPSGTLAYIPEVTNEISMVRTLEWVDRNGKPESLGAEPNAYSNPRISPDGRKLALSVGSLSTSQIQIWDLVHGYLTPRTSDKYINTLPLWTADGKRIVFFRRSLSNFEVHSMEANGSGMGEILNSLLPVTLLRHPSATTSNGGDQIHALLPAEVAGVLPFSGVIPMLMHTETG